MKRVVLGVVAVLALGLGGCATVKAIGDFMFGYDEETQTSDPSGGPAGFVSGILGLGNLGLGLSTLWASVRRKQYLTAAQAMAKGINRAWEMKEQDGKIDAGKIFDLQVEEQDRLGIRNIARKIVHSVEK